MVKRRFGMAWAAALLASTLMTGSALAVTCRSNVSFERWFEEFRREAAAQGISQRAIAAASPFLVYDARIVAIDRGQRFFAQTFVDFSGKMVPPYRIQRGAQLVKQHAATFARIEQQYGVPAPVIVAFWALESDFGANMGKYQVLRSLTTLAYDCRRAEMFRGHLFDALRLIEHGDLGPEEMIGSWAGELGQNQMMPTEYMKWAVDYDGDGRRNLIKSVPDVLGSTANYLAGLGWRRGEPWITEVRVPLSLPWDQADLSIQHPRAQWARWGVTQADGRPLPADNLPASLILPMGRFGPAFLAYANFQAYLKWNQSLVYSLTAAYLATRIAGAPAFQRGSGTVVALSPEQIRELQQLLTRYGYKGEIDGKLGLETRGAVKTAQMKLGMPADSWPTPELIERLRAGR